MAEFKMDIANRKFSIETNKFAKQADGSVMVKYGDTYILATAVVSKKESTADFFPLTINYEEKLYAMGKIPGNYNRREAKPSENATLAARLIDRPIRPMFPEKFNQELQVYTSVMSLDKDCEPEVTAINAASIALSLASNIPFLGPIGAVNVGLINGKLIINPTVLEKSESDLELRLAGTKTEITMVEAKANQLSEEQIIEAIMFGHKEIKKIVEFQIEVKKSLGINTIEYKVIDEPIEIQIKEQIIENYGKDILRYLQIPNKQEKNNALDLLLEESMLNLLIEEENQSKFKIIYNEVIKDKFRYLITNEKLRPDGRKLDEIRSLDSIINLLPRVHGSALFTRGETQALATVTLGQKSDLQKLDNLELQTEKTFMLHYNFPAFSVGETRRVSPPNRREIGHGNLAEKALFSVMPSYEKFPYTTRIVSEILESNGSSSQASICAGSLALMQAGVPIENHVAGIAMGLIKEDKNYSILTDIQGLEDHLGDMDFKVAGTKDGICTIQMDIKISGISNQILVEGLEEARKARLEILKHMEQIIDKPREILSEYAPKSISFIIDPNKIRVVIGKNGDMINKIIEKTNVKIDIEDSGNVYIYSENMEMILEAKEIILKLVKEYKINERYIGTVKRIEAYGAFLNFDGDNEVLIHISKLSEQRIEKVEDVVSLGQEIDFIIVDKDKSGKMKGKVVQKEQK